MKPFNEQGTQKAEFKKTNDYCLHGDVIVTKNTLPDEFDQWPVVKDHCIAYGEATGHAHKIFGNAEDFQLREDPKTKARHLRVVNTVMLKHQEHSPIEIPPGDYRTGIQTEWDPFEKLSRRVID